MPCLEKRNENRVHRGEEGVVLLMVILLVVMFSGLGLLAMRHVQGELRSSGAYMDSTQAAAAAEAGVMMTATDMRRNWRYPNDANQCPNYYAQFHTALLAGKKDGILTGFSRVFNSEDNCDHLGGLPVAGLRGLAPLALTAGPLTHGYATVNLYQAAPESAPPPPGYSSDDAPRTYDWYYFTVTSRAAYGFGGASSAPDVDTDTEADTEAGEVASVRGNAVVRAHMKIGPVDSIGSN